MQKKFMFPIAMKLIVIITSILIVANILISEKTTELFKDVFGKREEDYNRSISIAKSNEVSSTLKNLTDKTQFISTLLLNLSTKHDGKVNKLKADHDFLLLKKKFDLDQDFVNLSIFKREKSKQKFVVNLFNPNYLSSYKLDRSYLKRVDKKIPFPFEEVFQGKVILINRNLPQGAPLLSLGIPLVKDKLNKTTHIAVLDFPLNLVQKIFSEKTERNIYLIDKNARIIAHPNEDLSIKRRKYKIKGIIKTALESSVSNGQLRYFNARQKEYLRSAYSKSIYGLTVITEAPESLILEPAKLVLIEVLFVTAMVVFGAIFLIFLFSMTLTKPIKDLVKVAHEISLGNFMISASQIVRSRDEIKKLAFAFDDMIVGLKERDKVKNLFSKFQGSDVTDEMIQSEISAGVGKKLPVGIFFSDIRGFTAASEKMTPEEVVFMLNEYFNVMVKVIERNHGWVNKYIGDAIMAVWGAPKSTDNDSVHIVNACLEMRMALAELNEKRIGRGDDPLLVGMGIHYGEVVAGTLGSDERIEYTVIGDAVNLAARIEASTKSFGADLLLSQNIADKVKGLFILEKAGDVKVKGKSDVVSLYKVNGYIKDGEEVIVRTDYSEYKAEKAGKVDIV